MITKNFKNFNFLLIFTVFLSSIFLISNYNLFLSKFVRTYLYLIVLFCCLYVFLIYKNKMPRVLLINFLLIYLITIIAQELVIRSGYTWSTLEKVDIERRSGNDTYPVVKAATWLYEIPLPTINDKEFFPLTNPSYSNITLCRENNGWQNYQSDRFGFRNNDLVWDESLIENLFIGDSFTVGYCVPEENHFIHIFEENSKTLRLGNQTGPLTQLGVFLEYIVAQEVHVERIFWVFSENDIYNTIENRAADIDVELESQFLIGYLNGEIQNLANKQDIISSELKTTILENTSSVNWSVRSPKEYSVAKRFTGLYFILKIEEFISYRFLNKELNNSYDYPKPNSNLSDEYRLELFNETLNKINKYSLENNSELYILFLPSKSQLEKDLPHPLKSSAIQIAKDNNFKIIDFEPVFRSTKNELSELFGTGHYSVLGYSLIIDELNKVFNLKNS